MNDSSHKPPLAPVKPAIPSLLSPVKPAIPSLLSPVKPDVLPSLAPMTPDVPSKSSLSQILQADMRFQKRLRQLNEVLPTVKDGRVVPDIEDLIIGGARRLRLAVLFLDICKFSAIPSDSHEQQEAVLKILNLFMAEMLHAVRAHDGVFEKNTGDGLMAYFGEAPEAETTSRAVEAAVTMHCYNDQVISPKLKAIGLPQITFRVGIESGPVTIAKVGVRGDHHSLVAIGAAANIACKLMGLIPDGGIVLGNYARSFLSYGWQKETVPGGPWIHH